MPESPSALELQRRHVTVPAGGARLVGCSWTCSPKRRSTAERPRELRAVVSRGGRPDLAWESLGCVGA